MLTVSLTFAFTVSRAFLGAKNLSVGMLYASACITFSWSSWSLDSDVVEASTLRAADCNSSII